jgi:hypothetical protein
MKVISKEKGTHNQGAPEFRMGAHIVHLGQYGDEMDVGYVVEVHVDGGWGYPNYTVNLEGTGEKQTEGHNLFPVASDSQEKLSPHEPHKVPSNNTSKRSQAKKDQQAEKAYLKQMSEMAKQCAAATTGEKEIGEAFLILKINRSNFLWPSARSKRVLLWIPGTSLWLQRSLGHIVLLLGGRVLTVFGFMQMLNSFSWRWIMWLGHSSKYVNPIRKRTYIWKNISQKGKMTSFFWITFLEDLLPHHPRGGLLYTPKRREATFSRPVC